MARVAQCSLGGILAGLDLEGGPAREEAPAPGTRLRLVLPMHQLAAALLLEMAGEALHRRPAGGGASPEVRLLPPLPPRRLPRIRRPERPLPRPWTSAPGPVRTCSPSAGVPRQCPSAAATNTPQYRANRWCSNSADNSLGLRQCPSSRWDRSPCGQEGLSTRRASTNPHAAPPSAPGAAPASWYCHPAAGVAGPLPTAGRGPAPPARGATPPNSRLGGMRDSMWWEGHLEPTQ